MFNACQLFCGSQQVVVNIQGGSHACTYTSKHQRILTSDKKTRGVHAQAMARLAVHPGGRLHVAFAASLLRHAVCQIAQFP